LTAAEAKVARLLVADKTVTEISDVLAVTTNTVRFHLKQLFAKVGVRRQSELVRALLTTSQISPRPQSGQ
jgi:DNA-binding CsgD family transcriptional regulator